MLLLLLLLLLCLLLALLFLSGCGCSCNGLGCCQFGETCWPAYCKRAPPEKNLACSKKTLARPFATAGAMCTGLTCPLLPSVIKCPGLLF